MMHDGLGPRTPKYQTQNLPSVPGISDYEAIDLQSKRLRHWPIFLVVTTKIRTLSANEGTKVALSDPDLQPHMTDYDYVCHGRSTTIPPHILSRLIAAALHSETKYRPNIKLLRLTTLTHAC